MVDKTKPSDAASHDRNSDQTRPIELDDPSPSPDPAAFVAKARDLQALRDAVVDAATVSGTLWFSYVLVFFYISIAAGGVTHKDLLFENPVKLPFFNVDLPLVWFSVVGPILFLIVHAYVLLHFVLLARKVGAFQSELETQVAGQDIRGRIRGQLPSNIFVQFLAGPRGIRTGLIGFMLRMIAQVSLVAGPIIVLVFFQLQFLPYHDEVVSWLQRLVVLADIVLLWMLWPSVAGGATSTIRVIDFRRGRMTVWLTASLMPILLVFVVATFPGEWLDRTIPRLAFVPALSSPKEIETTEEIIVTKWRFILASPHELLFAGDVDKAKRRPKSPWSNRLVLPGISIIDHTKFDTDAKIATRTTTMSLRGRSLEGAVLSGADLRKVDFTGSQLENADLDFADLREAQFGCAGSVTQCTNLRNASLKEAKLQDAFLERVDLKGASLTGAQLQGANLYYAQLQGAGLSGANLQGTILIHAQLQGAGLYEADLKGADLTLAELQGADLFDADLKGALLSASDLKGASFQGAQLQGASFNGAELQGADFERAQLDGSSFENVFVWRARLPNQISGTFRVFQPTSGQKYGRSSCSYDWSIAAFAALKRRISEEVPKSGNSQLISPREFALLKIAEVDPETESKWIDSWTMLERSSLSSTDYEKKLAETLKDAGCRAGGSPIIRIFMRDFERGHATRRFSNGSSWHTVLATAFLDDKVCPGARGLSKDDSSKLLEIRDQTIPLPPIAALMLQAPPPPCLASPSHD